MINNKETPKIFKLIEVVNEGYGSRLLGYIKVDLGDIKSITNRLHYTSYYLTDKGKDKFNGYKGIDTYSNWYFLEPVFKEECIELVKKLREDLNVLEKGIL